MRFIGMALVITHVHLHTSKLPLTVADSVIIHAQLPNTCIGIALALHHVFLPWIRGLMLVRITVITHAQDLANSSIGTPAALPPATSHLYKSPIRVNFSVNTHAPLETSSTGMELAFLIVIPHLISSLKVAKLFVSISATPLNSCTGMAPAPTSVSSHWIREPGILRHFVIILALGRANSCIGTPLVSLLVILLFHKEQIGARTFVTSIA